MFIRPLLPLVSVCADTNLATYRMRKQKRILIFFRSLLWWNFSEVLGNPTIRRSQWKLQGLSIIENQLKLQCVCLLVIPELNINVIFILNTRMNTRILSWRCLKQYINKYTLFIQVHSLQIPSLVQVEIACGKTIGSGNPCLSNQVS